MLQIFDKYDENCEDDTAGFIEAPAFAPRERVRTKTVSPTLIIITITFIIVIINHNIGLVFTKRAGGVWPWSSTEQTTFEGKIAKFRQISQTSLGPVTYIYLILRK